MKVTLMAPPHCSDCGRVLMSVLEGDGVHYHIIPISDERCTPECRALCSTPMKPPSWTLRPVEAQ